MRTALNLFKKYFFQDIYDLNDKLCNYVIVKDNNSLMNACINIQIKQNENMLKINICLPFVNLDCDFSERNLFDKNLNFIIKKFIKEVQPKFIVIINSENAIKYIRSGNKLLKTCFKTQFINSFFIMASFEIRSDLFDILNDIRLIHLTDNINFSIIPDLDVLTYFNSILSNPLHYYMKIFFNNNGVVELQSQNHKSIFSNEDRLDNLEKLLSIEEANYIRYERTFKETKIDGILLINNTSSKQSIKINFISFNLIFDFEEEMKKKFKQEFGLEIISTVRDNLFLLRGGKKSLEFFINSHFPSNFDNQIYFISIFLYDFLSDIKYREDDLFENKETVKINKENINGIKYLVDNMFKIHSTDLLKNKSKQDMHQIVLKNIIIN